MLIEGEEEKVVTDEGDGEDGGREAGDKSQDQKPEDPDTFTMTKAEREELIKSTRKEQDKRWKDRLKLGDEEDDDPKPKKSAKKDDDVVSERLDRSDLRVEGVKDKAEQDIVIEYARFKKMDVLEALGRPAVQAELKAHRDKSATPAPSRRTSGAERMDDVEYWVDQYKKGKSAPTSDMRRKVRARLRGS